MAIIGTVGDDSLTNTGNGSDVITGLAGDDTLASIHDDTLVGGPGNDLIESQSPFSTYNGVADYESATGAVHVTLTQSGPQAIGADQGTDTLVHIRGVIGSAYGDVLSVGPGDTVTPEGYASNAVFEIDGGSGNDSIIDG